MDTPHCIPTQSSAVSYSWDIKQLPGLSMADQENLVALNVRTTLDLLQRTKTLLQRQALASQLQLHIQHVNKWAALADLSQIPNVGCQYCGLLLHAGISSPTQLAQTSLPRLHQQLLKLQVAMLQRPDLCPSLEQVRQWIEQARSLSRGTKTSP